MRRTAATPDKLKVRHAIGISIPRLTALIDDLRRLPGETQRLEFRVDNIAPHLIGERISALANSARLMDKPFSYFIWGVENETHNVVGTKFEPSRSKTG